MIKIYALLAVMMLTSTTSYSLISKKEWVSLCRKAKGERRHTCNVIRRIARISPLPFGNWGKVYDLVSRAIMLNLVNREISDLSPLSGLTNLEELLLSYNNISDLSPLSGLHSLRLLFLENNLISDLSPLRSLKNLKTLDLGYNQIEDLSPLTGSTNLQSLELQRNQISNLNPLSGLTRISTLNLKNNRISDLSPLSGFSRLLLYLEGNNISDPTPLIDIPDLDVRFNDDYLYNYYADARCNRNFRQLASENREEHSSILINPKKYKLINRYPRNEISNENINCSICLNDFKIDEKISELPKCHHIFHMECIGKWIGKHGYCPYCRTSVDRG